MDYKVITGVCRSGTHWLARALRRCNPKTQVHHEPLAAPAYKEGVNPRAHGNFTPVEFWRRRSETMKRHFGERVWEVSCILTHVLDGSDTVLSRSPIMLVRNPYKVVRSWLNWHRPFGSDRLRPRPRWFSGDLAHPAIKDWSFPTEDNVVPRRPEQLGWFWWVGCQDVLRHTDIVFRLEDLTSSFSVFQDLCNELSLRADENVWRTEKDRRVYSSQGNRAEADPASWDTKTHDLFLQVCGQLMERLGYDAFHH